MALVKEIIEASKTYGREFTLLIVVLSAFGVALKVVWDSTNTRLQQQDARIEQNDTFIRETLMKQSAETVEALKTNTEALKANTQVIKAFQNRMDHGSLP